MFSVPMLERLRQSLALWLAVQYAIVFALSAAILFGVLYWVLARALEERDQAVVEQRAAVLTLTPNLALLSSDSTAAQRRMGTRRSCA